MFDVARVDFSSHPQQVTTQADLDHTLALIQSQFEMNDLRVSKPNGKAYKFQVVTMHDANGKTSVVVFDNPAYLCNDKGDTVDIIKV